MMDTLGEENRDKELMVFDWDLAARLIAERKPAFACAGLKGDWPWTGGIIYSDGVPIMNTYTYLASTWAVPELYLDGDIIECFRMQSEVPNWDSATKWPESALAILQGAESMKPIKVKFEGLRHGGTRPGRLSECLMRVSRATIRRN